MTTVSLTWIAFNFAISMSPFKLLAAPRSLALLRQLNKLGVAKTAISAKMLRTIINSMNVIPSALRTKGDLLLVTLAGGHRT
jgi:hypothetical protein